jgi:hypothetical protein
MHYPGEHLIVEKKGKTFIPVWVLILDIFGTLILALGFYTYFGGGASLFSGFDNPRQAAIVLIIIGALLILPMIIVIVRRGTNRQ